MKNTILHNTWIVKTGANKWLSRPSDLALHYFFLWGALKKVVRENLPSLLHELTSIVNILAVI